MSAELTTLPIAQNSPLLVDTNILIDVLRNRDDRGSSLASLARKGYSLTTSAINVAEVYAGLRPGEESATQMLLDGIKCVSVSGEIAPQAGTLRAKLRRVGRTHTLDDMIVAATALQFGCPC